MASAKLGIDVVAGLVPGTPMEEFTRRWFITGEEWAAAVAEGEVSQATLLADVNGKAQAWAMYLMLQPGRVNWVKTEWVWF